MSDQGIYLYGICRPGVLNGIELEGVEPGEPVGELEVDGFAGVVSRVPLQAYAVDDAKQEMADPTWVIPRAIRHEQVLEQVLGRSPVFPARFGMVFSDRQALQLRLACYNDQIRDTLNSLENSAEWDLKLVTHPDQALQHLIATDPDLSERSKNLSTRPGARYLQEKRLDSDARRVLRSQFRSHTNLLGSILNDLALGVVPLTPRKEMPGQTEGVGRFACLLSRDTSERTLELVRDRFEQSARLPIQLQTSGPWPPFHFCPTLEEEAS